MVLYAAATSAIQGKLEAYHDHLHRPMIQHIDMDWLDHVAQECTVVAKAYQGWNDFPCWARLWHRTGAAMMLISCHIFYWLDKYCFGEFTIQTPINKLQLSTNSNSQSSAYEASFIKAPFGYTG